MAASSICAVRRHDVPFSVTPPGQMCRMAEIGYRTTYLHVPGAGHLIHDDAPQIYQGAVESFLTTLVQRT